MDYDLDDYLGTPEEIQAEYRKIIAMYPWKADDKDTTPVVKKKYYIGHIYTSNQIKGILLDFSYMHNKASLRLANGLRVKVKLDTLEAYTDAFADKTRF